MALHDSAYARPGAASPPMAPPGADGRQALVSAQVELRTAYQQLLAGGLPIPWIEAELDRMRTPAPSSPLLVWIRGKDGSLAAAFAGLLGAETLDHLPAGVGDLQAVRDGLHEWFTWRGQSGAATTWLVTAGVLPPELAQQLAYDADFIVSDAAGSGPAAGTEWLPPSPDALRDWFAGAALTDPRDPLRERWITRARLWRCQLLHAAIDTAFSDNLRRLRSRKLRDEIASREVEQDLARDPLKPAAEGLRTSLEQLSQELQRSITDAGRVTFGPDGTLVAAVRGSIDQLGERDLLVVPGDDRDKLRLNDRSHAQILDVLKQHVRNALKQDWRLFEDGRLRAERLVLDRLQAPLPIDIGQEAAYLQAFSGTVVLENTYSGDIPKAGFLTYLAHGKQAVFSAMAALTLLGMLFQTNWRQHYWIVLLMVPLFVAGAVYSSRSMRRDKAARMAAELDKVRDSLQRDTKRIVQEVSRERQMRVQATTEQIRREALRQIEAHVKAVSIPRNEQLQRARNDLREKARSNDSRLRDAGMGATGVARARATIAQGLSECERALRVQPVAEAARP